MKCSTCKGTGGSELTGPCSDCLGRGFIPKSEETIDITKPEDRAKIVETLAVDIDDWCVKRYDDGHRKHLGASVIGKPCARELWYGFRWVKRENYGEGTSRTAGQIMRLFQRGHREEPAIIEFLTGIGCTFEATPEDQIRISDIEGHFGGSLDNVGKLPERFKIPDKILFEFKTSNMTEFNKLEKEGMKICKPVHWSQVCTYGFKTELKYCLYVCIDKNSDRLYMELLELDWEHGKSMLDKAGMIITAKEPPPKYAMSPTNFVCKWCSFSGVCHNGKEIEKNCRSCVNSTPGSNGEWLCDIAPPPNNVIPAHVIPAGCPSWKAVR